MSTFNIDVARSAFVKGIKTAYEGLTRHESGIHSAALVCVETADAMSYGQEWVSVHATKLPLYLREYHVAMTAYLTDKGHSKPAMYWKRVRNAAERIYAERQKEANGGQPSWKSSEP